MILVYLKISVDQADPWVPFDGERTRHVFARILYIAYTCRSLRTVVDKAQCAQLPCRWAREKNKKLIRY